MIKDKVEEVKLKTNSLVELIVPLRYSASYSMHGLSRGEIGDITPCTDFEIMEYLEILKGMKYGDDPATLAISKIVWESYGNCAGDELYPVTMEALLLPGKERRFYVTIHQYDETKEYVWYPPDEN